MFQSMTGLAEAEDRPQLTSLGLRNDTRFWWPEKPYIGGAVSFFATTKSRTKNMQRRFGFEGMLLKRRRHREAKALR